MRKHCTSPKCTIRLSMVWNDVYIAVLVLVQLSVVSATHRCPEECTCFKGIVDCRYLSLTDIPSDDINPSAVFWLLSDNNITSLRSNSFEIGRVMKRNFVLDLSENQISYIEEHTFSSLHNLEILNLRSNNISFLAPLALKSEYLASLELSHNPSIQLPEHGFSTPRLRELLMMSCCLTTIPKDFFQHMEKLEDINLSFNEFTHLDADTFRHLRSLKRLNLALNMFTDVLGIQLHHLHKDVHMNFDGNRFVCSCVVDPVFSAFLSRKQLDCIYNENEMPFSHFVQIQCNSSPPSTAIITVTNDSLITTFPSTTTPIESGVDATSAATIVSRHPEVDDTSINRSNTDVGAGSRNESAIPSGTRGSSRKFPGGFFTGWYLAGICMVSLVVVAGIVALEIRRRRSVWYSNPQRFSILTGNAEAE